MRRRAPICSTPSRPSPVDAGSTRLRLDSSAFLADAEVPWQGRGYVVGPPYDGDADVETWAERTLDPRD